MGQVDVTANFIFAWLLVSDEKNRRHSAVPQVLFTPCQSHKEWLVFDGTVCVRKSFHLSGIFVFLSLLVGRLLLVVLLSGQNFTFAVITNLNKLSGQFLVFQVEKILIGHLTVKVLLVTLKSLEGVINNFSV